MKRYTPAQQQAILAEGHTLIEAGAGSGKTTTLVGKILHALGAEVIPDERIAHPCELSQIAAITFTEASAADLKRSLRKAFRTHAQQALDPTDADRWRRRVYELERARIGTIHAFCAGLLRDSALRAGLHPDFRILDETESAVLRRDSARRVLLKLLDDEDQDATELVARLGFATAVTEIASAATGSDTVAACLERWGTAPGDRLAAVALRAAHAVRRQMERTLDTRDALDFDALIGRTRTLLRQRPDVIAGVRRQLRWLLIDEFQDTDPAQRDIAYRICGLDGSATAGAPSLCIVGDPKQSIYRFRRADVAVWNAVAEDFTHLGSPPIPLDVNYRSRTPILGFVNTVFSGLMDAVDAPHEVRYRALTAHRDYAGDDGLVEWLRSEAEGNAADQRRAEAEAIVERIRLLVTSGERCIRDDGEGRPRAATWKDVALLFRTRTGISVYQDALRRAGIPFYLSSGTGFFARQEVQDLRLLLAALAAPHDDLAWAGLLRSPWVGLTDESLLRMRMVKPGPFSAALDVPLPGNDGPRLTHAREWLRQLALLRDRVNAGVLVERALEASGYAEHLLLGEGGDLALANLRKAISMATGVPGQSLAEIVAFFDERADASERESDAALHTGGENVVVLSTVHGAKGLEWPVVFLCGPGRDTDRKPNQPRLRFDPEVGIALKPEGEEPADVWDQLRERERLLDRAEEKRLWYVAATRARDRLVLCGTEPGPAEMPDDGKTPLAWLLHPTERTERSFRYTSADGVSWTGIIHKLAPDVSAASPARPLPRLAEIARESIPDAIRPDRLRILDPPPPRRRYSASRLMDIGKPAEPLRRTRTVTSGAPDARALGNVLHSVLEHLREGDDLDAILDREIEKEVEAEVPVEWRQMVRALIETAHVHDSVVSLHRSAQSERELPFTWLLNVDGEPVHLEGVIDLAALVDGTPEVLDYKSHDLAPGEESTVAEGYTLQAELYAAALGELLGIAPSAFRFVFAKTGNEERVELTPERIADFRVRLTELLRDSSLGA